MDNKVTMEITNDKLEEAIRIYLAERTKENLGTVLNLLRPTKLLVPAMLKAPNQPVPCFLKNGNGETFLAVYTSKEQIPAEPKSQAILSMPFPACNDMVVKPELNLLGMVINPFTENLVLKKELVEKLHEADVKAMQTKQIKMTPEQFQVFVKKQVEFGVLPKRLFAEKESFVNQLCEEKEAFVNQIFAAAYKEAKLYPYSESDYSVMALEIAPDLTLIRIDFPESGIVPPLCYRVYITYDPIAKKAGYYTIEKMAEAGKRLLGGFAEDGSHINYGEAPVEGAEIDRIMTLARTVDEITS
ncbi:MAG: SseB family protein [Roseburia sp.]|nr:SseB family protein [Roseburia sp.]